MLIYCTYSNILRLSKTEKYVFHECFLEKNIFRGKLAECLLKKGNNWKICLANDTTTGRRTFMTVHAVKILDDAVVELQRVNGLIKRSSATSGF